MDIQHDHYRNRTHGGELDSLCQGEHVRSVIREQLVTTRKCDCCDGRGVMPSGFNYGSGYHSINLPCVTERCSRCRGAGVIQEISP